MQEQSSELSLLHLSGGRFFGQVVVPASLPAGSIPGVVTVFATLSLLHDTV